MHRNTTAILLPAIAYLASGRLAHHLSLPGEFPGVIWPPAGVALAAVLIMGPRAGLGVTLGAGVLAVWYSFEAANALPIDEALLASAGVGAGAALQALVAAWLVRRHIGNPGPLDSTRDIGLFMLLGGAVGCLINPLLGSGLLLLLGRSTPHDSLIILGRWWLGDVIGVLIVTPVIFTWFAAPRPIWRSRRIHFALLLAGALALVFISQITTSKRGMERMRSDLQHEATRIANESALHLAPALERMRALASMLQAHGSMDQELLARFLAMQEGRMPVIQGPWIPPDALPRPDDAGDLAAYQVYLAVQTPAGTVLGMLPLGAIPGGPDAARAALEQGEAVLTEAIRHGDAGGMQHGPLVLWPIFAHDAPRRTAPERRQGLRGFVGGRVPVGARMEEELRHVDVSHLSVRIWEQSAPDRTLTLYAQDPARPVEPRYRATAHSEVAGRGLHVELIPAVSLIRTMRAWYRPAILIPELLIAALVGSLLLLVTGHRARLEALAAAQADALDQAQATLRQTEFLRRLVDADVFGIMVTDLEGKVYEANNALLDIIGYTREDLEQTRIRWTDLTPPEHVDRDLVAIAQIRETGVALAWEKEYIRKDGTRVPVMIGAAIIDGAGDRQVSFVADLTRVKQTEAALARQTAALESYKLIVNSAPIAISAKEYSAERQGVYILLNPKAREVIGIEPGEQLTDRDWLPPEVAEQIREQDLQILASGKPVIKEERMTDLRTGTSVWHLLTKVPLFDSDGKPYALAVMTQDITEQRQLVERQAALADAIPDLLFRLGADGVYRDFRNNRDLWLLAKPDRIIGTSILDDPLPGAVQQQFMTAIRKAIQTSEIQEIEYDLETPRGMRHFEARLVKSGHDEVVALVRDITDARRIRAALEEANHRLRLVNQELREFASVASHDLQEPLRTVHGFVDLLVKRYGDAFDDKGRKWLEFIVSGTQRMRDLINDLLTYSRVGRVGSIEEVDTAILLDEIVQDSRASIVAAGAGIEIGPLPTIRANRTELRQIFQNLISNALKFRRPDVPPRVEIRAEPHPGGWRFVVADNGIGIEAVHHERIFQVFQRLHTREEYPGTGIGLAVVKKIIERQGGSILVQSTPGEGTTFCFVLPARPRLPSEVQAE